MFLLMDFDEDIEVEIIEKDKIIERRGHFFGDRITKVYYGNAKVFIQVEK